MIIDINKFRRNQSRIPRAKLEKHNGQYVAWSSDGTSILAADVDPLRVDALVCAAGYDLAENLVSRVACPEEVSWNGWAIPDDASTIVPRPILGVSITGPRALVSATVYSTLVPMRRS